MNDLRQAAQQALEALENAYMVNSWAWVEQKEHVITALKQALAEPQTTHWEGCEAVHPECRATPRNWVGLTDEEVLAEIPLTGHRPITSFARAIEAKLKEKNNGS